MDKGARFYRCDFQVHSPRDCNWKGHRPTTQDGRKEYAGRFIAACRQKGLDAVAITDHHDLCFVPFIKAAATEEVDAGGAPVPDHRRIVIFPGMELTLAIPCQALLLFDSDIPVDVLPNLYPLLGVTPNSDGDPTHVQPVRLDAITTFDELCNLLDRNDYFRGRYIVLPNVGGHGTMMRPGFTTVYKTMPCVGGYLDKPVSRLDDGTRRILDGKIEAYGSKRLGLFQTSDSRNGTFDELGTNTTWVKWATPTAEALRQACLACDTRISQSEPIVPAMVIARLEVSDSKFLGPIDLHFNPQYSCLIGGRGTGKSTILEYLRWAMCDQPPIYSDEDDAIPYQEKRASLIENTLRPQQGVVTVTFHLNSVTHVVRRSSETKDLKLKIGSDEFKECTEGQVRDLLPLQAYSQKQLSAVGIRTDELVRFIRTSVKGDLDRLGHEIEDRKTRLKEIFGGLVRRRKLQRDLERQKLELASLTKQVEAVRQGLKGLTAQDRQALEEHDPFLQEEQFVEKLGRELDSVREMASDFRKDLAELPSPFPDGSPLPNAEVLRDLRAALAKCIGDVAEHVDAALRELEQGSASLAAYEVVREKWRGVFAAHQAAYDRAKSDASSEHHLLTQIAEADAKIKALRIEVDEREGQIKIFGSSEDEFARARGEWMGLHTTVADILHVKCEELTALSTGRIRAKIGRGAGTDKVSARLLALLSGTGIRTKKVEDLCDLVTKSVKPMHKWAEVADELEKLVDYSGGEQDEARPRTTPLLTQAGFSAKDLDRLTAKLTPEQWIELALTELEDVPKFEYRQSEGLYIQFAEASAGQQATALLRVLLNQQGPPLVIDQPEEDLDNQVIQEIVQEIWKAKRGRQIIFSSHNPNIVVNGDADLVICCDYRTAGDHSGGKVKLCGAIDVDAINKEITVVMEGGRDAFRLRKEKYGF